ncbi:hypothetical protein Tco_0568931 [Tanacetum coccineum]
MKTMNVTLDELSAMAYSWKVYSVICLTNNSNGENHVVSKSSAVTTADASDKRQQQQDSTLTTSTLATSITADGNFDFQNRRDLPRNTPLDRVEVLEHQSDTPLVFAVTMEILLETTSNKLLVIEQLAARSGMDLKMAKTCYHSHCLNTYLGKINTRVPISSYELSTLNSASNVVLEWNWVSHSSLSHRIDIGAIGFGHIGISCIKFLSHSASLPTPANVTNSDSIVEPVMHVCFLEAHEMAPC